MRLMNIICACSALSSAYGLALSATDGHVRPTPDPNPVLLGGDPFDREKYSAGLAAGGVDGLDLRPFYPEIFYNGQYYPICGIDFNDEAAAMACRDIDHFTEARLKDEQRWNSQERFTYGGRVVKTNVILEQDAMPVGACLTGETLDECTAGGNAFGDFEAMDGRCKKGNPVGVQIVCYRQCRKFGERLFLEEHLETVKLFGGIDLQYEAFRSDQLQTCKPFLKNSTTYYLTDETQKLDSEYLGSQISQFASLLDVMGQKCSANVVELICHTVFKECKEVDVKDPFTGGVANVMLPSLLCKSECEKHKLIWDECYANIQKDAADKELFDSNMHAMSKLMSDFHMDLTDHELPTGLDGARSPFSLLDCDAKRGRGSDDIPDEEVAASWILGRYPQTHFERGDLGGIGWGVLGWAFPRFVSSETLYPEEFATYTGPDGVSSEVPCTIPGQADSLETITCSPPFTTSILPETNRACVHACPMDHFTQAEYTTMWAVFSVIGICSFVLNVFMVTTWKLTGWQKFEATPYQLKACVFFGLLYGVVETIPTLILKFDLPCKHSTEEEIGSSAWCYLNRSGQYMILGIMVNLCTLTILIFRGLVNSTGHESNTSVNAFSTAVPVLFMVIAYILDTSDQETVNYHLNVARHGFNCSMRFSNMVEEWLVLWLPFCVSCVLTAIFSIGSWWKIGGIERVLRMYRPPGRGASYVPSQGQSPLAGQRRRLIRIAAMVSVCLLLSLALVGQATVQQAAWTDHEEKKLDCLIKTGSSTRNFEDYGFNDKDVVRDICPVPDGHPCNVGLNYWQREYPLVDASTFILSCGWYPSRSTTSLQCNLDEFADLLSDDRARDEIGAETIRTCECSCSDLLLNETVERSPR